MAIKKDLSIDYLGVHCENPFFLSSSCVGGNYEMVAKALETGWGGVFYKTISDPVGDHCSPRYDISTKEGTPWIALKNMEVTSDKPLDVDLDALRRLKKDFPNKVIVASIMGSDDDTWVRLTKKVTECGVDLIELNFSCPQMTTSSMGSDVGTNPELVKHYCEIISQATDIPIIAKMTPNLATMEIPGRACIEGGAAGLSAINTVKSITNINLDFMTAMPVVNGRSGVSGLSGAAVKPIGLRFCSDLKHDPILKDVPLSGIGGIESWQDALEYILLGCENVQVTTAVMQYGYRIVEDLISGLSHYMEEHNIDHVSDLVGKALSNIEGVDKLDRSYQLLPRIDEDKCIGCGRCYISCYDGQHQAIEFNPETRKAHINEDRCVGCHLCLNVCPVMDCIHPHTVRFKEGEK